MKIEKNEGDEERRRKEEKRREEEKAKGKREGRVFKEQRTMGTEPNHPGLREGERERERERAGNFRSIGTSGGDDSDVSLGNHVALLAMVIDASSWC